jgi:L-aspartate oxidase
VSRSIALHLAKLGDPNGHVYLDARVIEETRGAGFLERRFPTLTRKTRDAGIDWTRELVPVAPAAHYWMGGIITDLHARTSIPGLYAAGETACTGVQGANRLASNSLLEGLVFGRRAVEAFLSGSAWVSPDGAPPRTPHDPSNLASSAREPGSCGPTAADGLPLTLASGAPAVDEGGEPSEGLPSYRVAESGALAGSLPVNFGGTGKSFSRDALRRLMTSHAGVLRSGELLAAAADTLEGWAAVVRPETVAGNGEAELSAHEDRNLLLAAQLLVSAARRRRGSLGAHYRSDNDLPGNPADFDVDVLADSCPTSPKASLVRD